MTHSRTLTCPLKRHLLQRENPEPNASKSLKKQGYGDPRISEFPVMRLALLLAIGALFVFSAVLMGPDKSASAGEPHGNDSQADSESYVAIDDSRRVEVLQELLKRVEHAVDRSSAEHCEPPDAMASRASSREIASTSVAS